MTTTLYQAFEDLFAKYPLAVESFRNDGTAASVVLMLPSTEDLFILLWDRGNPPALFSLRRWRSGEDLLLKEDGTCEERGIGTAEAERVPGDAVPLLRDGSLLGWVDGGVVTTLVTAHLEDTEPPATWSASPLAGIPESQWPPFTGERLFGHWAWEHVAAGRLVDLSGLVAQTRQKVWWVPTTDAVFGSGMYAVQTPITYSGVTLPSGVFAYYQALRAGAAVPSLGEALATTGKTDLGPRFR